MKVTNWEFVHSPSSS